MAKGKCKCKCECDCKHAVLRKMIGSLDARLCEAHMTASCTYSGSWIRENAHRRAMAILEEYQKIREML